LISLPCRRSSRLSEANVLKQAVADFQFSRSHALHVVWKSGLMKPVVGSDSGSFIFTKTGGLSQSQLTDRRQRRSSRSFTRSFSQKLFPIIAKVSWSAR